MLLRTCIQVTFTTYTQQSTIYFIFLQVPSPQASLSNRSSSSKPKSKVRGVFFSFFSPSPRALSLTDFPVVRKIAMFFFLQVLEPSPLELTTGATKKSKVRGTLLFSKMCLFDLQVPLQLAFSILLVISDAFFLYFT